MGAGIAQVAAQAGHVVKLLDNRPGAAAKAVDGIRAQFARLAEKGKISAEAAQAAGDRLVAVEQLADLADAALVVELGTDTVDRLGGGARTVVEQLDDMPGLRRHLGDTGTHGTGADDGDDRLLG
jgi:hypothetical protein